jgi:tetratricopeptide (TPR) repeat protein
MQGNADAAVEYYRKALEIDPMSLVRYADLGYKLAFEGSREEAQAVLAQVLERFPNAPGTWWRRA